MACRRPLQCRSFCFFKEELDRAFGDQNEVITAEEEEPEDNSDTRLRAWLTGNMAGMRDPTTIPREGPGNQRNSPASTPSDIESESDTESEDSDREEEQDDNEDDVGEMNSPTPEQLLALIGHPLFQGNSAATPQMEYSFSVNTPTPDSNMPAALRSVLRKGFVLNPTSKPKWRIRNLPETQVYLANNIYPQG